MLSSKCRVSSTEWKHKVACGLWQVAREIKKVPLFFALDTLHFLISDHWLLITFLYFVPRHSSFFPPDSDHWPLITDYYFFAPLHSLFFKREHPLPIFLHPHNRPAAFGRFVEAAVEFAQGLIRGRMRTRARHRRGEREARSVARAGRDPFEHCSLFTGH